MSPKALRTSPTEMSMVPPGSRVTLPIAGVEDVESRRAASSRVIPPAREESWSRIGKETASTGSVASPSSSNRATGYSAGDWSERARQDYPRL